MLSLNSNPLTNLQTGHALTQSSNHARKFVTLLPANIIPYTMTPIVVQIAPTNSGRHHL
jgi:hypothetical protein